MGIVKLVAQPQRPGVRITETIQVNDSMTRGDTRHSYVNVGQQDHLNIQRYATIGSTDISRFRVTCSSLSFPVVLPDISNCRLTLLSRDYSIFCHMEREVHNLPRQLLCQ